MHLTLYTRRGKVRTRVELRLKALEDGAWIYKAHARAKNISMDVWTQTWTQEDEDEDGCSTKLTPENISMDVWTNASPGEIPPTVNVGMQHPKTRFVTSKQRARLLRFSRGRRALKA